FTFIGFAALLWLVPWFLVTSKHLGRRAAVDVVPKTRGGFLRATAALVTNRNLLGICLGFFCFDYYWSFLVNWLPDYLVTSRGMTSLMTVGLYAALPYFVFGACEPIGGWIADRLVKSGWSETRARKGVVTFAFLTGLLLIPAAQATSVGTAVMLIVGGCLVGLSTGNLLVILPRSSPPDQLGLSAG